MKRKRVTQGEIAVEKSSGNVYADLGYADGDDMLVKAQIVAKIAEIIEQRQLTQERRRKRFGLPSRRFRDCFEADFGEFRRGGCCAVLRGSAGTFKLS